MDWDEIEAALAAIRKLCSQVMPITAGLRESGIQIARRYPFQLYDSIVVAAALGSGAKTLFIEDLQDGQTIGPLTIRNPFLSR